MKKEFLEVVIKVINCVFKLLVFAIDYKCGRVVVFHNVTTLWGESIKTARSAFMEWHHVLQRPIILQSKEGLIISIHGCIDGTLYLSKTSRITVSQLATMLPAGEYFLIACYNGARLDYDDGRVKITRVKNTIKRCTTNSDNLWSRNIYVDCSWDLHNLYRFQKWAIRKFC